MVRLTLLGVVMMSKVLSAVALAAVVFGGQAVAQSVAGVGEPRELPPAGYTQQQYVDSRGCVYLRAGLGGTVRWVPRVGPDREALCGATPTFKQAQQAAAALDAQNDAPAPSTTMTATAMPAPAASARVPLAPAATAAAAPVVRAPDLTIQRPALAPLPSPLTTAQAPMVAAPMPAPSRAPVLANGTLSGNRVACFKSAPVLQRVALSNGGSALVCTRGDGSLTGWRAPVFPGQSVVGAGLTPPTSQPAAQSSAPAMIAAIPERSVPRVALTAPAMMPTAPAATRVVAAPPLPKGYVSSWKDDRLNPMRGLGTAQGQAQQDRVWTRDIPAEAVTVPNANGLVYVSSQNAASVAEQPARRLTVSSMGAATAPTSAFIQIGAFGNPANAQGAAARLAAAGLPVASQQAKGLKVILAGPFASAAEAQQALGIVRGAGFGDAFIR
jgi:hypothetical protein